MHSSPTDGHKAKRGAARSRPDASPHPRAEPSRWVTRHGGHLGPDHHVLDVASGSGRHLQFFLARGCTVTGVDRTHRAASDLRCDRLELVEQDLEDGSPWPFGTRQFDAVIVTNYLHRPRLPHIIAAVRPGGLLVYETFSVGNERFGRPRDPRFLLRRAELLEAVGNTLQVLAYEDLETPRPARVQRIAAARGPG